MKVIYEPKGKAREYCDLAANLYRGCEHGCVDCYAPAVLHMKRDEFTNNPSLRPGVIEAMEKEAPKYAGREVHLCFTTDPYQPIDKKHQITRKAIKILKANNITVRILTKGGLRSTRDFDLLEPDRDWYGATLTFTGITRSVEFEPLAAPPLSRIEALKVAHELGIRTWVSLEPVRDPEETLKLIKMTHPFVDAFKVGKWNYDPRAKEIDWKGFVHRAVELLDSLGKEYYIKDDLRKFLN